MAVKTKGAYCNACQKNVMAQSNKPNHVLHLILTVVTAGLWGLVWLLLAAGAIGGYRCTQCGQAVGGAK
jgi:hypothetical protein